MSTVAWGYYTREGGFREIHRKASVIKMQSVDCSFWLCLPNPETWPSAGFLVLNTCFIKNNTKKNFRPGHQLFWKMPWLAVVYSKRLCHYTHGWHNRYQKALLYSRASILFSGSSWERLLPEIYCNLFISIA